MTPLTKQFLERPVKRGEYYRTQGGQLFYIQSVNLHGAEFKNSCYKVRGRRVYKIGELPNKYSLTIYYTRMGETQESFSSYALHHKV